MIGDSDGDQAVGLPRDRRLWFLAGALVVAVGLGVIAVYIAEPVYGKLKAKHLSRQAAASLAAGDYKSAVMQALKVLDVDSNNVSATRTVARTLDAVDASGAIQWHRRLEDLAPGDAENLIAWAKAALKAQDATTAGMVLNKVKPEDLGSAAYHAAAAGVALAKRDFDAGESHLVEAVRLDPAQNQYKLELAELRLKSGKPQAREEALQALEALRARPETNLAALRLLIQDAANRREPDRVRELGESLEASPSAGLEDRLVLLSARRVAQDPDFFSYLEHLKAASVHNPNDLASLIAWMNVQNLAIAACEWISTLPVELTSKPPVSLAAANSFLLSSDWTRLKQSLESSPPDQGDFFRLALQSRLLKHQGDTNGARDAWKRSLDAAKMRPAALEGLARMALALGWQQESEETLWALCESPSCPRWAIEALWDVALKSYDTGQIYRVAQLRFKAAPDDLTVRANFIYLALLTRNMQENPQPLAEALYKEYPAKAVFARNYGLSLYLQGRKKEALQVMEALPPKELEQPPAALYYCIFLAAAGQFDKARAYLPHALEEATLPEEQALLANAQEALRAAAKSQEANAAAKGF